MEINTKERRSLIQHPVKLTGKMRAEGRGRHQINILVKGGISKLKLLRRCLEIGMERNINVENGPQCRHSGISTR